MKNEIKYVVSYNGAPLFEGKRLSKAMTAMCVKMWRKGDFDKLVEFVKKNYKIIGIE
mgnify:FL=1